jgi:hypothetical protein
MHLSSNTDETDILGRIQSFKGLLDRSPAVSPHIFIVVTSQSRELASEAIQKAPDHVRCRSLASAWQYEVSRGCSDSPRHDMAPRRSLGHIMSHGQMLLLMVDNAPSTGDGILPGRKLLPIRGKRRLLYCVSPVASARALHTAHLPCGGRM